MLPCTVFGDESKRKICHFSVQSHDATRKGAIEQIGLRFFNLHTKKPDLNFTFTSSKKVQVTHITLAGKTC